MLKRADEADLLFGRGNGNDVPEDEATLIFAMQSAGLSLPEKLRNRDLFRAASPVEKEQMLTRFCGQLRAL